VHNWATDLTDPAGQSVEILFATEAYAVVDGKRYDLDLSAPAPAGFHMLATKRGDSGGNNNQKRGGVLGLPGRVVGRLFGRGGGGGKAADAGAGVNGTAAAPKAISSGALHSRLAPGAA
jgi:hypothetical protein